MRRRLPAAAKLVGAGTRSPRVYIRDRRGRWVLETYTDEEAGRQAVRMFEGLAAWARADGARRAGAKRPR